MALIADWLREAYPRLAEDELATLLHFVSAQHPGKFAHNIMRHQGITAFLEAEAANDRGVPSLHALLALGHLARERSESADSAEAGRGERILIVAMHAINTLAACAREGGARNLFGAMLRAPNGDIARRYRALEYATDCVHSPPPDPRDAPPPSDESPAAWSWRTVGRMLLQQLMMAVIAATLFAYMGPSLEVVSPPGTPAPSAAQSADEMGAA